MLDLSHALAGPFCSTMLADYGAQVVKIEPPGAGDIARAWGSPMPGGETAYFVSLHRNKKGVAVDLKNAEGRELFLRMVERADVVLENYRVGTLEKLGIDYATASKRNPGIVYCSISGYGQDGPYRERAALDLILQAESGMISVTGDEGSHGARCGVSIADLTAGMNAAYAILLALRVKEKTGEGQAIDVSMMEGQLALLGTMLGSYFASGEVPAPMGTAYKALLPYQTFATKTRDLALAVGSEKLWRIFCPLIGLPGLADGSALQLEPRARRAPREPRRHAAGNLPDQELRGVGSAARRRTASRSGRVNTLAEVVKHPQVVARKLLRRHRPPESRQGAGGRRARAPVGARRARCARPRRRSASTPTKCCATCLAWASAGYRRAARGAPTIYLTR